MPLVVVPCCSQTVLDHLAFCTVCRSASAFLLVELLQVLSIYWFLSTLMFSFFVLP